MEPLLLGLTVPSIASTAGAVGRAVSAVTNPLATPFASLLQAKSQPADVAQSPTVEIEDLEARADALQEDLERRIFRAIDGSGLQLNSPVRLQVSEFDGELEVDGDHPQRTVLEAALASDPSIASDFRELAAVRKLLSAAETHQAIAGESSGDPWKAIAAYASQGDDRYEAVLQLSTFGGEARLDFE